MSTALLAVDLGLRLGWAHFDDQGALLAFGSRHVGKRRDLDAIAWAWTGGMSPGAAVVAEGDRLLAAPFERAALKRGLRFELVSAEQWRRESLLAREQRSGRDAKAAASERARRIIEASPAGRATSLRHDAAEAIVLGDWFMRSAHSAARRSGDTDGG